jgi:raffinose/stachyose/melibiose transport system permease protein
MVLLAVVFAIPMYILVNTALKQPGQAGSIMAPATSPTLNNFVDAWNQGGLGGAIVNNILITVSSVTLIVLFSAAAAYPLARITRRWSRLAFAFFLGGLLVPSLLAMIPLYTTFRDLGLIGSIWALVIIYVGAQMPFSIFLYVQFLRSLPLDYEEAATLDGCTAVKGFWLVVFPLLRPITGTVVILNAIFVWNDFFTPLLYLGGTQQQTIPVAIYSFTGQYVSQWNLVFAALIVGIIPILIFYLLMQKSIIKGFAGGLKG